MSDPLDSMPRPELKNMPPPKDGETGAPPSGAGMSDFGPGAFFAPALRSDSEQFPVLKAFQTYLEEERERARRRVVAVSVAAIAAIVLIVAAFLVILMNQMNRNDQLFAALLSNSGRPSDVASTSVSPSRSAAPDPQVVALNEKIARLEKANSSLAQQMEGLQTLPEALADRMGSALSNALATASAKAEAEAKSQAQKPVSATAPSAPVAAKPTVRVSKPKKSSLAKGPTEGPIEVAEVKPLPSEPPAKPAPAVPPPPKTETLKVAPVANAKPMVDGYRGESIVLTTDAGVKIPWRIAVEK